MIVYFLGIIIFVLGISFGCGFFTKYILKINFQCNVCALGFIIILGVFQIIALPFMYLHANFTCLYVICIIVFGGMMLAGIVLAGSKSNKMCGENLFKIVLNRKVFVTALALIAMQCVAYIFFISKGTDDSFYLPITNTIIESDRVFSCDPTTGTPSFLYFPQYELVGYEVFGAVICKLFQLNAAQYYHVIFPVIGLIIHYLIVYDICKIIAKCSNVRYRTDALFLIFTIFNLFSGYTGGLSRGSRLLGSLWHGKAVLINIILPFLIIIFLEVMLTEKVEKNVVLILLILFYTAFGATTVGVYLFPLSYAGYVFIFLCKSRKIKEVLKLCIPVIFALPYVVLKYRIMANTGIIAKITEGAELLSYITILKEFNGRRYMLAVYGIALLVLLIFAEKNQKYLFAIYPIFIFFTYLNPFLHVYMAQFITGTDVYDRLFWLPQITFTFIAAIACIMYHLRNRSGWITVGVVLVGMLLSGCKFRYYNARFEKKENLEGITNTTKQLADTIIGKNNENNRLILPQPYVFEVRQYTGKIELVWSLYVPYVLPQEVDSDYAERLDNLYNVLYNGSEIDGDIWNDFSYFNIKYVGMYAHDTKMLAGYPIVYTDSNLIIYDVEVHN